MRSSVLSRLGPAAGVVGTGLLFAGLMTASEPPEGTSPTDAPASIAATLAANADRTRTGVAFALAGLSLVFWFLGWLRGRIRAAAGGPGVLDAVAFGGGVAGSAGLLVYLALLVASSNPAVAGHPDAATTILLLQWEYGGVLAPAYAALVGATSVAVLRHRLLPPALAPIVWLGLPLALALAFGGFLGGALVVSSLLWLLVLAAAFFVRPTRASVVAGGLQEPLPV